MIECICRRIKIFPANADQPIYSPCVTTLTLASTESDPSYLLYNQLNSLHPIIIPPNSQVSMLGLGPRTFSRTPLPSTTLSISN